MRRKGEHTLWLWLNEHLQTGKWDEVYSDKILTIVSEERFSLHNEKEENVKENHMPGGRQKHYQGWLAPQKQPWGFKQRQTCMTRCGCGCGSWSVENKQKTMFTSLLVLMVCRFWKVIPLTSSKSSVWVKCDTGNELNVLLNLPWITRYSL